MLWARRPAGMVAVAAVVACLVVAALVWPERSAHATRPHDTPSAHPAARPAARLAAATAAPSGFALVGHRGYPGRHVTENTLPSFRRAVRYGATAVELDVQLTRDGRLLVLHDPSLDRTTTCHGRADRRTLRWIQVHCRGRRGHEPLPSLTQALDVVRRLHTHVVVDVKRPPSAWTSARYHRLVGTIRSQGLVTRTVVLGFHRDNLEAIRRIEPGLRVQAIADDLAEVRRMRTWADGLNLPASIATPRLIAGLRGQGLMVLGRRTGLSRDWSHLRSAGADGLLTDDIAPYRTWLARQG